MSYVSGLDLGIVVAFLVMVTLVGYVLSKRASAGMDDYFLGGRKIPWWILGISSATSNFDVSGTMIIVAMVFSLGYKGFLVELRGGTGLALAFLLVFLGKWLRRSRVMTSAEWMKLRFGTDRQGRLAHMLSALANIALSLGMIVYFAKGSGKFLTTFLPFSELTCTAAMVGIGLFYTLMSGLYGVVFTDVLQMLILTFTAVYVTVEGYALLPDTALPETFLALDLDTPALGADLLARNPANWEPVFALFGVCVALWAVRSVLEGCGGVGGYTDQRFFAARSEREASMLTLQAIVLSAFRWTMVAGLVVMGYHLLQSGGPAADIIRNDPEQVLPTVLHQIIPVGMKGVVLAGLIAAAMSTFDSTLNAGASYIVRDVYQSYIKPVASVEELMRVSKWATFGLCLAGVGLAALVPNINVIWGLITMGLGAGLFVPLFLRWYWPRFNGYGFAIGTATGAVAGLALRGLDLPLYYAFPGTVGIALLGAIVGTLATPAVDRPVLIRFAQQINPWGLWEKYRRAAVAEGLTTEEEYGQRANERLYDFMAVCFAVPAQMALLIGGMAVVLHDWSKVAIAAGVLSVCAPGMYWFWYRNLRSDEVSAAEDVQYDGVGEGQADEETPRRLRVATGA